MFLSSGTILLWATAYNHIPGCIFGNTIKYLILTAQAETPISRGQISFPLTMAVEGSKSSVSGSQYCENTSSTMNEL